MAVNQGKNKLKDPFKVVLLREETLEEVGSYRLTLLNVYLLVSTVLVITSILVFIAIFFTPLKRFVPGYGDVNESPEYLDLRSKVISIEKEMEAQQLYINSFRKIALGDSAFEMSSQYPGLDRGDVTRNSVVASNDGAFNFDDIIVPYPDSLERLSNLPAAPTEFVFFISPLVGTVSRNFDLETEHYGIDVVAPLSTPVKSILEGYVITSDWTLETGNTIGIQHGNGIVSFYKHNARNLKRLGAYVRAGEAVAIIGNTGEISTGPHLHFELWIDGHPVNPLDYLDFQ